MLLCGVLLNPIKFLAPFRRGLLFLITYFSIVFFSCLISVFVFIFILGTLCSICILEGPRALI